MKQLFALFLTLFFISISFQQLSASTLISDGEEIYGNWTKYGSPYIIEGEATVPRGRTLTILPGVVVKLAINQKGRIYVEGNIKAVGKSNDWIEFTKNSDDDDAFWGAILVRNSQKNNIFKYCKLRS